MAWRCLVEVRPHGGKGYRGASRGVVSGGMRNEG